MPYKANLFDWAPGTGTISDIGFSKKDISQHLAVVYGTGILCVSDGVNEVPNRGQDSKYRASCGNFAETKSLAFLIQN